MTLLYEPSINRLLAALFSSVAIGLAWRGTRRLLEGLRQAEHPAGALGLVRGIRAWIVALALGAWAAGVLFAKGWVLLVATLILAEELYETGVVSLALRSSSDK